jgi:hypothetical protein
LPFALDKKYPNARREWGWHFFFRRNLSVDPRSARRAATVDEGTAP